MLRSVTAARVFCQACLVIVLTILVGFEPAWARTWNVLANTLGDAPTVQAGIDSAASGDTVLVHPGT